MLTQFDSGYDFFGAEAVYVRTREFCVRLTRLRWEPNGCWSSERKPATISGKLHVEFSSESVYLYSSGAVLLCAPTALARSLKFPKSEISTNTGAKRGVTGTIYDILSWRCEQII
jgi:hypothetical protein